MVFVRVEIAGGDTATPLNLKKRLDRIGQWTPMKGVQIADCGCGEGAYVAALAQQGADVVGVEFSSEKVAAWQASHPADGRVIEGNIECLPWGPESKDVAILNEVLEHVPDDRMALAEVFRVLRPGGLLLLFSPNRRFPFETHGTYSKAKGTRISPSVPFIPYLPIGVGQRFLRYWARNYWPAELESLIETAGFTIVAHDYVWQTFENISGRQPWLIKIARPMFRLISSALERIPILRTFGASQLVVARKPL